MIKWILLQTFSAGISLPLCLQQQLIISFCVQEQTTDAPNSPFYGSMHGAWSTKPGLTKKFDYHNCEIHQCYLSSDTWRPRRSRKPESQPMSPDSPIHIQLANLRKGTLFILLWPASSASSAPPHQPLILMSCLTYCLFCCHRRLLCSLPRGAFAAELPVLAFHIGTLKERKMYSQSRATAPNITQITIFIKFL